MKIFRSLKCLINKIVDIIALSIIAISAILSCIGAIIGFLALLFGLIAHFDIEKEKKGTGNESSNEKDSGKEENSKDEQAA